MLLVKGAGAVAKGAGGFITRGGGFIATALEKMFAKGRATAALTGGVRGVGMKGATDTVGTNLTGMQELGPKMQKAARIPFTTLIKNITIGVLAIAGLAVVMAGAFWTINKMLSGITTEEVKRTTMAMGGMVLVFAGAGIVIAEAAVIGAGIIASGGLGAVAAGAGFAAMAWIVGVMVAEMMAIMKAIDQFKPSAGFNRKVDAFVSILTGISGFAKVILDITEEARPSFGAIRSLFGGNPEKQFKENLGSIKRIIKAIGGSVSDIIAEITVAISGFSEEQLRAGSVIGTMLQGVAELLKAMQPPPGVTGGQTWLGDLYGKVLMPDNLGAAANYFQRISRLIPKLVAPIKTMMKDVSGMKNINSANIQAFGSFIQAIGSLLQALSPSQQVASLMEKSTSTKFWQKVIPWAGDDKKDKIPSAVEMMGEFMGTLIEKLSTMMPKMKTFMSTMTDISKESQEIGNLAEGISTDMTMIKDVYIGKISSGVKDTVAEINNIATELNKLNAIDVKAQLRRTSDTLGLKGTEELKIKLENLAVNINVAVKVDAKDLETVLTKRPGNKFATT
jgi:hypothetical protein